MMYFSMEAYTEKWSTTLTALALQLLESWLWKLNFDTREISQMTLPRSKPHKIGRPAGLEVTRYLLTFLVSIDFIDRKSKISLKTSIKFHKLQCSSVGVMNSNYGKTMVTCVKYDWDYVVVTTTYVCLLFIVQFNVKSQIKILTYVMWFV